MPTKVSKMAGGRKKKAAPMAGGRRRRRAPQNGGNIFQDAWGGLKKAANWVKDNKLISRGASLASMVPSPYSAHLRAGGAIAGQLGLGRRQQMGGRSVIRI